MLATMSPHECTRLMRRGRVGRLAFCNEGRPEIVPVNYVMAGEHVLVATAGGAKLDAARHQLPVAFEVDHLDPVDEKGWSVVAHGTASEVTDPRQIEAANAAGLQPWAGGTRPYLVAITVESLAGRRIEHPWETS
jgi:uncharacterized protein